MPKRQLIVLAVLATAFAGCGGDDSDDKGKKDEGSSGASAAEVTKQDVAAKSNARTFVTEVETCFVDQQSYSACQEPEGSELDIGSGPGQVEVSEAADATYTVVAHSESGTNFEVVKDDSGSLSRTCDKEGEGGCRAGGSW